MKASCLWHELLTDDGVVHKQITTVLPSMRDVNNLRELPSW